MMIKVRRREGDRVKGRLKDEGGKRQRGRERESVRRGRRMKALSCQKRREKTWVKKKKRAEPDKGVG